MLYHSKKNDYLSTRIQSVSHLFLTPEYIHLSTKNLPYLTEDNTEEGEEEEEKNTHSHEIHKLILNQQQ